jgi:hypothetical protein
VTGPARLIRKVAGCLQHVRMETLTIRKITYIGPPEPASALAQLLREQGVEVKVAPPLEMRSAASDFVRDVAVEMVASGGLAAIFLAVRKFREWFPHARVEIGGDQEDQEVSAPQPSPEQWWAGLDEAGRSKYRDAARSGRLTQELFDKMVAAGINPTSWQFLPGGEWQKLFPPAYIRLVKREMLGE